MHAEHHTTPLARNGVTCHQLGLLLEVCHVQPEHIDVGLLVLLLLVFLLTGFGGVLRLDVLRDKIGYVCLKVILREAFFIAAAVIDFISVFLRSCCLVVVIRCRRNVRSLLSQDLARA